MEMEIERVTPKNAEVIFWLVVIFILSVASIFPHATDTVIAKASIKMVLGCSAALWIYSDSKKFKAITHEKAYFYSAACFMLPEIVGPIYVFSSRGFKGGIISSLNFILKAITVTLVVISVLFIFGYE